jgi:hypothetical protein
LCTSSLLVRRSFRPNVLLDATSVARPLARHAPLTLKGWSDVQFIPLRPQENARDVTFDKDRSQVRTLAGPQVMATLRNTEISILRLAGHTNIAAATRHPARDPHRTVTLLLTS